MKRGGLLSFLVGTMSNVLVMEIGWTDVGSGGYILVSSAHSNTSYVSPRETYCFSLIFFLQLLLSEACPDHNFFVFPDRSIIFGMWVHDQKAVCHIP